MDIDEPLKKWIRCIDFVKVNHMRFIVAANYRLKSLAEQCVQSIEALGYHWTAFDLGGLGFGQPFYIDDETFQSSGFYRTRYQRWPSRAMHKPRLVANFLKMTDEPFVYLDADTLVRQRIDEVAGNYDIGVTIRRPREIKKNKGRVNAGVIFFNPGPGTEAMVERWQHETEITGNDQAALNQLLDNREWTIREFPTNIYNWYYFPDEPPDDAKILHFRISMDPAFGPSSGAPSSSEESQTPQHRAEIGRFDDDA